MSDSASPAGRLFRSESDRMISGVAGGIAEIVKIDPTLVRLLWVLIALVTSGVGLLAYLAMWVIVPPRSVADARAAAEAGPKQAVDQSDPPAPAATATGAGESQGTAEPSAAVAPPPAKAGRAPRSNTPIIAGVMLIVTGALFLVDNLVPFDYWSFIGDAVGLTLDYWPIFLIAAGAILLFSRLRPGA